MEIKTPMETAEILRQFERITGKFERAAVEAAVERREEITPEFLRILEDTIDRSEQFAAERGYMAHLYSMYLLAQFREVRAYAPIVRFASLPSGLLESLWGEFITEDLSRVLASVCGGELGGIQSLIENESADEWVRGAALDSLVTLVAAGQKCRDEIVGYFASLFRGKLVREWSHVWDALVSRSSDLYPVELLDDIERAYEQDLVDPGYIDLDDVKRALTLGQEHLLDRLADDPHRRLMRDAETEMGWWACFGENRAKYTDPRSPRSKMNSLASSTIRRETPKTGRNEPCPWGSGKKYKKCCGG